MRGWCSRLQRILRDLHLYIYLHQSYTLNRFIDRELYIITSFTNCTVRTVPEIGTNGKMVYFFHFLRYGIGRNFLVICHFVFF